jgi:hypothetical protein
MDIGYRWSEASLIVLHFRWLADREIGSGDSCQRYCSFAVPVKIDFCQMITDLEYEFKTFSRINASVIVCTRLVSNLWSTSHASCEGNVNVTLSIHCHVCSRRPCALNRK